MLSTENLLIANKSEAWKICVKWVSSTWIKEQYKDTYKTNEAQGDIAHYKHVFLKPQYF